MKRETKEKKGISTGINTLAILALTGLMLSNCSSTKPLVIKPGTTEIKDRAYFSKYYTSI